ncbi:flavin reductase [Ruminococcus albus]|uniref:Flavin reductase domain protein FMN-binding protein n=1 Tax=Ruminococcus albus (strain ATCC 27210 / DSM 20455 / JCM 14654 / NCDO 2250 / 7) TaxID=697329 RepID=E6UII1_RUMA7|nr:flavin reductase [Ruminococcus albus]ADU23326.1 flavin reductase domain protein FMN-binding protein [Ruminococcus albus 7 = DSM 20455]
MDMKVMNKITYGLYVLTARCGNQFNGCIINTLAQVTTSPNRVSVTVNKGNFTEYMIRTSGRFNVSMIDESADFSLFTHFGFQSGRWGNKFYDYALKKAENGLPIIEKGVCAYISCEVVQTVDLGTHTMFIADVADGEVISDKAPMTYAYYHANVKPKPAAASGGSTGERWVCNICGYIYEGHLPDDFVCPLCKHGAADFTRMDGGAEEKPSDAASADDADEKWVCEVCGYVYEGALPEDYVCPVCGVGADQFKRLG